MLLHYGIAVSIDLLELEVAVALCFYLAVRCNTISQLHVLPQCSVRTKTIIWRAKPL